MLRIGLVGLGRMGMIYANILTRKANSATVVAACSLNEKERTQAYALGIKQTYAKLEEMLEKEELDILWIVSSTLHHVSHISMGLEAGCHIFSEKPLAITSEECLMAERLIKAYPSFKVMIGFVRRYDESYLYAHHKITNGSIGRPLMIRSQTVDKDDVKEFQIQYAKKSGGIFHDYNIHDIDLTHWLMDEDFVSVQALGGAYKYPAFADMGDADYVTTSCQLSKGSIANISASRIAMHGHDTYTEITGTEGSLLIGRPSNANRVEIYDTYGARHECLGGFMDRFDQAFVDMSQDFINIVKEDKEVIMTVSNARKATEVATAFSKSYEQQKVISL